MAFRRITNFHPKSPTNVRNGTPAFSSLIQDIINNQHFLAVHDTPAMEVVNSLITNTTVEVYVEVPPLCTICEFHVFACASTERTTTDDLVITGETTSMATNFPGDTATMIRNKAGWIHFVGAPDATGYNQKAVQVVAAPSLEWRRVTVNISVSNVVKVYRVQYRAVPGTLT